jgi:uncharacterized protein (DUF4415 family)
MDKNEKTGPFRFEVVEEKDREVVIEVKQEDYENDLAAGIPEEELLKPGRHTFKRSPSERRASKEDLHPSNIKVEFQMKLDLDVLNHFQEQTGNKEIESLQKLLNRKLRKLMENEKLKEEMLNDKKFIRSLAEEIRNVA